MALAASAHELVAFICMEDIAGVKEPRATGFFVGCAGGDLAPYLVTAWHVVQEGKPTWVRLRRRDGGPPDDVRIEKWYRHGSADVAIAPVELSLQTHAARWMPEWRFADLWVERYGTQLLPGDTVTFIGLLSNLQTMGERALPLLRGGVAGAFYQERVSLRDEIRSQVIEEPCAHLIDCHSVAGFSGSPVFVQQPLLLPGTPVPAIAINAALLGVLIGHFEGPALGVGIVVPVEAVRELLNLEAIVEDRQRRHAAAAARGNIAVLPAYEPS